MLIAIANQKGGVAKTTSTIALGGVLADQGPCLLIDLDPQGNLTTGLGIELQANQLSTYDVITDQVDVMDAVVETTSGLSLVPSDISLAKGETEILTKVGNFLILKERIAAASEQFDHILIDCPPSLGLLTINALSAADAVLIPVQCQYFALKGLADLMQSIQSVQKRLNKELKILGVLPTIAEKQTVMTRDVLAALSSSLPSDINVFSPVPKSVRFPESNLAGEPIHIYAKDDHKLFHSYLEIAKHITAA